MHHMEVSPTHATTTSRHDVRTKTLPQCFTKLAMPKNPPVIKILRRVNFGMGSEFGTEVAKRYGEGSDMFVFLDKKGRKPVHTMKDYGSSNIPTTDLGAVAF